MSNFNTRFWDSTKRFGEKMGMQTHVRMFNKYIGKITKLNLEAIQWLNEILIKKWTLVHNGGRRFGIMTNNLFDVSMECLKMLTSSNFISATYIFLACIIFL